jgi:hypothetical protein
VPLGSHDSVTQCIGVSKVREKKLIDEFVSFTWTDTLMRPIREEIIREREIEKDLK